MALLLLLICSLFIPVTQKVLNKVLLAAEEETCCPDVLVQGTRSATPQKQRLRLTIVLQAIHVGRCCLLDLARGLAQLSRGRLRVSCDPRYLLYLQRKLAAVAESAISNGTPQFHFICLATSHFLQGGHNTDCYIALPSTASCRRVIVTWPFERCPM